MRSPETHSRQAKQRLDLRLACSTSLGGPTGSPRATACCAGLSSVLRPCQPWPLPDRCPATRRPRTEHGSRSVARDTREICADGNAVGNITANPCLHPGWLGVRVPPGARLPADGVAAGQSSPWCWRSYTWAASRHSRSDAATTQVTLQANMPRRYAAGRAVSARTASSSPCADSQDFHSSSPGVHSGPVGRPGA